MLHKIACTIINRYFNEQLFLAVTHHDFAAIEGLATEAHRVINPRQKKRLTHAQLHEMHDQYWLEALSSTNLVAFLEEQIKYLQDLTPGQLNSHTAITSDIFLDLQRHMKRVAERLFNLVRKEIYPTEISSLQVEKRIYLPISFSTAGDSSYISTRSQLHDLHQADQNERFFYSLSKWFIARRLDEYLPMVTPKRSFPTDYTWQNWLTAIEQALITEKETELPLKQNLLKTARKAIVLCQEELNKRGEKVGITSRAAYVGRLILHSPGSSESEDAFSMHEDQLPDFPHLDLEEALKVKIYHNWVININAKNAKGNTIFHEAMLQPENDSSSSSSVAPPRLSSKAALVLKLFEYSRFFDFNAQNNNGDNPLQLSTTKTGHTALHYLHEAILCAPVEKREEMWRVLLDIMQRYPNFNKTEFPNNSHPILEIRDENGVPLLERLMQRDQYDMVGLLLEQGVPLEDDIAAPVDFFHVRRFTEEDIDVCKGYHNEAYVLSDETNYIWYINQQTKETYCCYHVVPEKHTTILGELGLKPNYSNENIFCQAQLSHRKLRTFYKEIERPVKLSSTCTLSMIKSLNLPIERKIYYALLVYYTMSNRLDRGMKVKTTNPITPIVRHDAGIPVATSMQSSSSSTIPVSIPLIKKQSRKVEATQCYSPMRTDTFVFCHQLAEQPPEPTPKNLKQKLVNVIAEALGQVVWHEIDVQTHAEVLEEMFSNIIEAHYFQTDCELLAGLDKFTTSRIGQHLAMELYTNLSKIKTKAAAEDDSVSAQNQDGHFGPITAASYQKLLTPEQFAEKLRARQELDRARTKAEDEKRLREKSDRREEKERQRADDERRQKEEERRQREESNRREEEERRQREESNRREEKERERADDERRQKEEERRQREESNRREEEERARADEAERKVAKMEEELEALRRQTSSAKSTDAQDITEREEIAVSRSVETATEAVPPTTPSLLANFESSSATADSVSSSSRPATASNIRGTHFNSMSAPLPASEEEQAKQEDLKETRSDCRVC